MLPKIFWNVCVLRISYVGFSSCFSWCSRSHGCSTDQNDSTTLDKQYLPSAGRIFSSTDEAGIVWWQTERNWTNSILEVDEKLKLNLQYNKDLHVLFTGGEMSHRRNDFQSNPMEQDSRLDQSPNPLFSMVFHTATTATAGKKEKKRCQGGRVVLVNHNKPYFLFKPFQKYNFPLSTL